LKENKLKELNSEIEESKKSSDKENSIDLTQKLINPQTIFSDNELDEKFNIQKIDNLEISNMSFVFENIDNDDPNKSIYSLKISEKDSLFNVEHEGNEINNVINQIKITETNSTLERNNNIMNDINLSIKDINKKPLYQVEQQTISDEKQDLLKNFEKKSFDNMEKNIIEKDEIHNSINKCESPLSQNIINEERNSKQSILSSKSFEDKLFTIDIDKDSINGSSSSNENNKQMNYNSINNDEQSISSLKSFERKSLTNYNKKYIDYENENDILSENENSSDHYSIHLKDSQGNKVNQIIENNKIKSEEYNRMLQRNEEILKDINKSYSKSSTSESLDSDIPEIINSNSNIKNHDILIKKDDDDDYSQMTDPIEELNILGKKLKTLYENHPIVKSNSFGKNSFNSLKSKPSYELNFNKESESNSTVNLETFKKITQNSDKHHNYVINQWNNEKFKKSDESLNKPSSSNNQSSSYQQLYSKLRQSFTTNSLTFNTLNNDYNTRKSDSLSSDILNIKSNDSINDNENNYKRDSSNGK